MFVVVFNKKVFHSRLSDFEMILKQLISFARSITCNIQAAVVRKVDNSTHRINPIGDSVVCFANIYPLKSDLCGGWRYAVFEKPELTGARAFGGSQL